MLNSNNQMKKMGKQKIIVHFYLSPIGGELIHKLSNDAKSRYIQQLNIFKKTIQYELKDQVFQKMAKIK